MKTSYVCGLYKVLYFLIFLSLQGLSWSFPLSPLSLFFFLGRLYLMCHKRWFSWFSLQDDPYSWQQSCLISLLGLPWIVLLYSVRKTQQCWDMITATQWSLYTQMYSSRYEGNKVKVFITCLAWDLLAWRMSYVFSICLCQLWGPYAFKELWGLLKIGVD